MGIGFCVVTCFCHNPRRLAWCPAAESDVFATAGRRWPLLFSVSSWLRSTASDPGAGGGNAGAPTCTSLPRQTRPRKYQSQMRTSISYVRTNSRNMNQSQAAHTQPLERKRETAVEVPVYGFCIKTSMSYCMDPCARTATVTVCVPWHILVVTKHASRRWSIQLQAIVWSGGFKVKDTGQWQWRHISACVPFALVTPLCIGQVI